MDDNEVFNVLFNEMNTYEVLPEMFKKVTHEVVRSEFDVLKNHAILYHISGMVDIVIGAKEALKDLEDEVKLLGINLEEEMDEEQLLKYYNLKDFFKNFE